jgi:streptomycin 6-kinase
MPGLIIPTKLADSIAVHGDERRRSWLARLPDIVEELAARWSLRIGAPFEPGGECAWVARARDASGQPVVLKVSFRYEESEHEAAGLQEWAGEAAVLLHDATEDDDTLALLLEACDPGTELGQQEPEERQDEIVAGLLPRLWREPPAGHPFRPLSEMCDQWADEHEAASTQSLDPGLARDGVALFRALPRDPGPVVLLATDLHAGNILSAQREPWLVVDPKPYVGDPHYDPLQHMLNCEQRLLADPHGLAHRMADLLDLDADRILAWLFARSVVECEWWPQLRGLAERLAP